MIKKLIKNILVFLVIHLYWNNKIPLEKIFSNDLFFQNKMKKYNYFVFYHKKIFKLIINPILNKYKTINTESEILIHNIIITFLQTKHPELDEKTLICIYRILYELKIEDNLVFSNLFEIEQNTNDIILKYWLIQSIEIFAFWRTLTLPSDYYFKRKHELEIIANNLIPNKSIFHKSKQTNSTSKKNICIVTYLLGSSLKNSVQRVLQMITDNIDSEIFDISIVCLDSFYCKKNSIANITDWGDSFKFKKQSKALLNKNIHIYYCNSNSIKKKIETSLGIIYNINPDLIIDISDEYSVSSFFYEQDFPTIYIPLRGRVTSSFCNIYKTSDYEETLKQNTYYNNILDKIKIVEWSFPEYVMKSNTTYTRKQFQLNDNSFIMVSAGILPPNDKKFFETMSTILDSNESFVWIIVGSKIPEYFTKQHNSYFQEKRIIEWGYEKNLDSLYRICDVFVNPNKTGGSGTIAIAAQQKLPIVLTDFPCDAMRWIKKENCISDGYDGFLKEINQLKQNNNYYLTKSKLFFDLVTIASDSKSKWDNFNQILKDSITEWQEEQKKL